MREANSSAFEWGRDGERVFVEGLLSLQSWEYVLTYMRRMSDISFSDDRLNISVRWKGR